MGIKITDMTAVPSAGGTELLAASVSGAPRKVTVDQIKDRALAALAAVAASASVTAGDGVFVLKDGSAKPADIDLITQRAIDIVWGKAAEAAPADAGKVPLYQGAAEKTLTLSALASYIQTTIRAAVLNPATLDSAGDTADEDVFILGQSGVAKKIAMSDVKTAVLSGLLTYVTGLTAITTAADADEFFAIQGGVARKVTFAKIKAGMALDSYTIAPGATTAGYVPIWSSTSKTLEDGLEVRSDVRADGSTDGSLVSETAIRAAIVASVFDWSTISEATEKPTPVDADYLVLSDSEASGAVKRVGVGDFWDNVLASKVPEQDFTKFSGVTFDDALTAYTLVLADAGRYVRLSNANPIALTVPLNSAVAFAVGTVVEVEQAGAGSITVAGDTGVTVNAKTGLVTDGQYSTIRLIKVAADAWTAIGGVAAV